MLFFYNRCGWNKPGIVTGRLQFDITFQGNRMSYNESPSRTQWSVVGHSRYVPHLPGHMLLESRWQMNVPSCHVSKTMSSYLTAPNSNLLSFIDQLRRRTWTHLLQSKELCFRLIGANVHVYSSGNPVYHKLCRHKANLRIHTSVSVFTSVKRNHWHASEEGSVFPLQRSTLHRVNCAALTDTD